MNKKKLFAPLALLGAFLLAGCSSSTIVAKPTDWDKQHIIDKDGLKDNTMLKVYEAIKALGDTNSNVLNTILHKISLSVYGEFSDINTYGSKTFAEVKGNEDFKKFVNAHKEAYGCNINRTYFGNEEKDLNEEEKLEVSHGLIKNVYNQIIDETYKAIYTEITGGTYSTDNLFYEDRYVFNNLVKNMYLTVKKYQDSKLKERVELAPKKYNETYKEYVEKYLTLSTDITEEGKIYNEYFTRKLIPDVYRTMLIQNYVKTQRFSALGRTYARKIHMLSVPNGGISYTGKVGALLRKFASDYILPTRDAEGKVKTIPSEKYDFSLVEDAMRGFVGTDEKSKAYELLEGAKFDPIYVEKDDASGGKIKEKLVWNIDGDSNKKTHVFKGTKLGDIVEKYLKVYNVVGGTTEDHPHAGNFTPTIKSTGLDEAAYNDLTGTNAHTIEEGLTLKEREIRKTTFTKEGWFLKSGTVADLASDYKERLFSIETSNIIDSKDSAGYSSGDYVRYYDYGNLTSSKKHAFLTFKSYGTETEENLVVINDGTNYQIIEVEEAVSTSKLSDNINNTNSYLRSRGSGVAGILEYNRLANDVTIEASKGDTYKKNANQYYIMLSNIIVHDQSLYDYLKGQFPDLFNN